MQLNERMVMLRSALCALVICFALLVLPGSARAGSAWGELSFVFASDNHIVATAGRFDGATGRFAAFRYLHKDGAQPWSASHGPGQGVSHATFERMQDAAVASQSSFDAEATGAFGSWYDTSAASVRMLFRSVTRENSSGGFRVATELAGVSPDATLADWSALKQAADAGDRQAFDAAAVTAWGAWYSEMDPVDADLVYQIVIDFTGAG